MHGFEPVVTNGEAKPEVGENDVREVSAVLVHGLDDSARQLEEEAGWQATAMGEIHAGAYCALRALLDLLPVLDANETERARVQALLDGAAIEACRDHFSALRRAGGSPDPELIDTLEDVFRGAVAGLVDNAILMHSEQAPGLHQARRLQAVRAVSLPGTGAASDPDAEDGENE